MKKLKKLIRAFSFGLPLLLNILQLILLFFFVYSCFGCFLFSDHSSSLLDETMNFSDVFKGMLVLFKCLTCDGWGDVMFDVLESEQNYNSFVVYLYFLSFMTILFFFLFNIFIMTLLKEFEDFYKDPYSPMQFYDHVLKRFKKVWSRFKMNSNPKMLKVGKLGELLKVLGPPLGVNLNDNFIILAKKISLLNLKTW